MIIHGRRAGVIRAAWEFLLIITFMIAGIPVAYIAGISILGRGGSIVGPRSSDFYCYLFFLV